MYGSSTIDQKPEDECDQEMEDNVVEPEQAAAFGVELNMEELKMVERVKSLKRQKVKHEGDALLGQQDFIGFAKTTKTASDRLMMEYEYVAGQAD